MTYELTWSTGDFFPGREILVTVSGVTDALGNPLGVVASGAANTGAFGPRAPVAGLALSVLLLAGVGAVAVRRRRQ
jgi:hypothetical protein